MAHIWLMLMLMLMLISEYYANVKYVAEEPCLMILRQGKSSERKRDFTNVSHDMVDWTWGGDSQSLDGIGYIIDTIQPRNRPAKISTKETFQRKDGFLPCLRRCLCDSCNKQSLWEPMDDVPTNIDGPTNDGPNNDVPTTLRMHQPLHWEGREGIQVTE